MTQLDNDPVRRSTVLTRAYARIPEGQVHYVTAGSGAPLLLVHETPRSWVSYARIIPYLADSHRVIAMDTLGFGNSDAPPDRYAIADYAQSVVQFLDTMGISRTSVLGDHTGALISIELAVRAHERVDRLILSGLPFFLSTEERLKRLEAVMARDLVTPSADGSHLTQIWNHLLTSRIPGGRSAVTSDDLELLSGLMIDVLKSAPSSKQMERAVFEYDAVPRLPQIKAPTLVVGVTGEGSSGYTKRSKEVGERVPHSRVHVFEGVDGRLNHTHTKEFSDVVREFLAS